MVTLRRHVPETLLMVEISPAAAMPISSRVSALTYRRHREIACAALAFAAVRTNGRRVCPCPDMVPRPVHPSRALTERDDWLGSRQA